MFPSQRTIDESGAVGLEEERRLAYVGITRARRKLYISFASSRRIHGQWQSAIPSRFVQELPPDNIIEDVAQGISSGLIFSRSTPARFDAAVTNGYGPGWRRMASQEQSKSDNSWQLGNKTPEFITGDRVFHQKFGMGNIRSIDGDKLEIAFDKAGHKKVVAGFVSKP